MPKYHPYASIFNVKLLTHVASTWVGERLMGMDDITEDSRH